VVEPARRALQSRVPAGLVAATRASRTRESFLVAYSPSNESVIARTNLCRI